MSDLPNDPSGMGSPPPPPGGGDAWAAPPPPAPPPGQDWGAQPSYGAQAGYSGQPYSTASTPQAYGVVPPGYEQKQKIVAGLLGIFLGAFGVHNFYLGFKNKALAQLLITVLTCGILSFVSGIWGLIEGIMVLTGSINADANGVPLKD